MWPFKKLLIVEIYMKSGNVIRLDDVLNLEYKPSKLTWSQDVKTPTHMIHCQPDQVEAIVKRGERWVLRFR